MNIKYLETLLSVLLYSSTSLTPLNDTYTISMPMHLDLNNSGSFNVKILDSSISASDEINIKFSDTFELKDSHGKPSIFGTTSNNMVKFNNNDLTQKEVKYKVENVSAGNWSGNLHVSVSVNRKAESNVFIDGPSINNILKLLNPSTITFSHTQSGTYLYDLSTAKDESILLYKNGNEVIIANNKNVPIKANKNMSSLFSNLDVETINHLEYIDMSACESMSRMFQSCEYLEELDVSSFDTSNVNDMSYMFEFMHSLTNLTGLENFKVSNVTTFAHLLNDDMALQSVPDLSNWNVSSKCTNLSNMLSYVAYETGKKDTSKWPTTVDYSNWVVDNVTNMSGLFRNAFNITTLNLSGWNTQNVTDISYMFEMDDPNLRSRLATISGIEDFDVRKVSNMENAFYNCISLTSTNSFEEWKPSSLTNLCNAFYGCKKLDLHDFDDWENYFDIDEIDYDNCFGGISTYKPDWY